jgi:FMN-binding domain.
MKKVFLGVLALLAAMVLVACGGDEWKDGTYKAEYKDFDDHGYKPYIEVTIKDGKITEVNYDEKAEDGTNKSEDENYGGGKMSVHPKDVYEQLEKEAVEAQSADVEAVSGATSSSEKFKELLDYVLTELAPKGTESGTID